VRGRGGRPDQQTQIDRLIDGIRKTIQEDAMVGSNASGRGRNVEGESGRRRAKDPVGGEL
jgi:hypothetical protein